MSRGAPVEQFPSPTMFNRRTKDRLKHGQSKEKLAALMTRFGSKSSRRFLRHAVLMREHECVVLVFFHDSGIDLLCRSGWGDVVFLDGTFRLVEVESLQLVIMLLQSPVDGAGVPVAYMLTDSRETWVYKFFLKVRAYTGMMARVRNVCGRDNSLN